MSTLEHLDAAPHVFPPLGDRETWLKERQTGIGSSDAPVVAGCSPWKTPFQLWTEKIGAATLERDETEAMEWGLLLEPVIAFKYAQETGRVVEAPPLYTIRRRPADPWCLATIDRDLPGPPAGILEIKTASAWKKDEWLEGPPLMYIVQVQHQLAVMPQAAYGSIAVLLGGQRFRWVDVPRNPNFIDALLTVEAAFWTRVRQGIPPDPDGSERTTELLNRLYPQHTVSEVIPLPAEALEWDTRREEAIAQEKHWASQRREAENLLRSAIGRAEKGILPDGTAYTWLTSPRAGYTVEPTTTRTLRRQGRKPSV